MLGEWALTQWRTRGRAVLATGGSGPSSVPAAGRRRPVRRKPERWFGMRLPGPGQSMRPRCRQRKPRTWPSSSGETSSYPCTVTDRPASDRRPPRSSCRRPGPPRLSHRFPIKRRCAGCRATGGSRGLTKTAAPVVPLTGRHGPHTARDGVPPLSQRRSRGPSDGVVRTQVAALVQSRSECPWGTLLPPGERCPKSYYPPASSQRFPSSPSGRIHSRA
jgi:hypothetical protein